MINNLSGEVWKDFTKSIWGKNKIYKISNFGRVIDYSKDPNGKLLKPYKLGGYEIFSPQKKDGETDLIYVHRAVAQLFLEQDNERTMVIHLNYQKDDNLADNLRFVNKTERFEHNYRNPKVIESKRKAFENPKHSKLSSGKVRMIKRKIFDPNCKTRMRLIAKQFGFSEMQLYRIKSGENWGHIENY
jgi:hypothetical protein